MSFLFDRLNSTRVSSIILNIGSQIIFDDLVLDLEFQLSQTLDMKADDAAQFYHFWSAWKHFLLSRNFILETACNGVITEMIWVHQIVQKQLIQYCMAGLNKWLDWITLLTAFNFWSDKYFPWVVYWHLVIGTPLLIFLYYLSKELYSFYLNKWPQFKYFINICSLSKINNLVGWLLLMYTRLYE